MESPNSEWKDKEMEGKTETKGDEDGDTENCLALESAIGVSPCSRDNILFLSDEEVAYPVANHIAITNIDSLGSTFFTRSRSISAMTISPNRSVLAVAEEGKRKGESSVSVYHLPTQKQIRTLSLPNCQGSVVSMSFSKDSKLLVTQIGLPGLDIVYWKWESEKIISKGKSPQPTTRVHFHPRDNLAISASGPGFLRLWKLASNFTLKTNQLIPAKKEQEEIFTDHIWTDLQMLVALAESGLIYVFSESGRTNNVETVAQTISKSTKTITARSEAQKTKQQSSNQHVGKLTLCQVIQMEVRERSDIFRPESLCSYSKGFLAVGSAGFLGVYEATNKDTDQVFMHVKSFQSSNKDHFTSLSVSPHEDLAVGFSKTSRSILRFPLGKLDMLFENEDPFTVFPFAQHKGPLTAMDVCFGPKPSIITTGVDKLVRIVDYELMKCELEHNISPGYGDPVCAAIHPNGSILVVGFKEHVRVFDVLLGQLREKGCIFLKHCSCVQFSHGGQFIACSTNIMVNLYSTYTAKLVHSFTEHIGQVRHFEFNWDDSAIASVGMDGAVYVRNVSSKHTIETVSHTFETCQLLCVACNLGADRVAVSGSDGSLREISGGMETFSCSVEARATATSPPPSVPESSFGGEKEEEESNGRLDSIHRRHSIRKTTITSLALSQSEEFLFAGTSCGSIRAYKWPLSKHGGVFEEFSSHAGAVTHLRMNHDDELLFSASSEGTCLLHSIQRGKGKSKSSARGTSREQKLHWENDADSVLVSHKEWKKRIGKIEDLKKEISDLRSAHEYNLHSKDTEWMETVRNARAESSKAVQRERQRYEDLQIRHEEFVHKHIMEKQKLEGDSVKVSQNLENEYEKRLWEAFRRVDQKSEALEVLKQSTEAILEKQESSHLEELEKTHAKYKQEIEGLERNLREVESESKLEQARFKEELSQQEKEYELEILRLKGNSDVAVEKERQVVARKKNQLVQQKNKFEKLKSKVTGLETNKEEDESKIKKLEEQVAKLQSTLQRYEQNIEERETAFHEKEKTILSLRSANKTLDNFRYVLDYRIEKLMEEKGPIQDHISKLEAHIKEMYTELVSEFHRKKVIESQISNKEMKVEALTNEVSKLRVRLREKDRETNSFIHIISTCVKLSSDPKQATQYITDAYKAQILKDGSVAKKKGVVANYQKPKLRSRSETNNTGEGELSSASLSQSVTETPSTSSAAGGNSSSGNGAISSSDLVKRAEVEKQIDMLLDSADYSPEEIERQREFMQRSLQAMQKSLRSAEKKLHDKSKRAVQENAFLIQECNDLRKESQHYKQKCDELEGKLTETMRKLKKCSNGSASNVSLSNNESEWLEEEDQSLLDQRRPSTSSYPSRVSSRCEDTPIGLPRTKSSLSVAKAGGLPKGKGGAGVTFSPIHGRPNTAGGLATNKPKTVQDWFEKPKQRKSAAASLQQNAVVEKLLESLDEANREIVLQRTEIRKLREQVSSSATDYVERALHE